MLDMLAAPAQDFDASTPDPVLAGAARGRERNRYRPGTREARRLVGSRRDRMAFVELLARHGDPAVAADQLGLPLFMLFRQRDADPSFAAEWLAAVNYAWERVESRVLAALLNDIDDAADPAENSGPKSATGSGKTARTSQIDIRLALAIVNRRDKPVTRTGGARPADGAGAAQLRAELRALAGAPGSR